jgi:hypothetical protein
VDLAGQGPFAGFNAQHALQDVVQELGLGVVALELGDPVPGGPDLEMAEIVQLLGRFQGAHFKQSHPDRKGVGA